MAESQNLPHHHPHSACAIGWTDASTPTDPPAFCPYDNLTQDTGLCYNTRGIYRLVLMTLCPLVEFPLQHPFSILGFRRVLVFGEAS